VEQESDRFDVIVTILIALVTVFGATIAWRASLAEGTAGDAEQQGLLQTLALEEGLSAHETGLYTHLHYFVRFKEHTELARRLRDDEAAARARGETALADDLAREAELHADLAVNLEDFFDVSYVRLDGTYDEARYLADLKRSDGRINGLAPEEAFAEADTYHQKAKQLIGLISLLTGALFFYTLSQITEHRIKYALMVLGSLAFLGVAVRFAFIEGLLG
jgi:hypothetical protein